MWRHVVSIPDAWFECDDPAQVLGRPARFALICGECDVVLWIRQYTYVCRALDTCFNRYRSSTGKPLLLLADLRCDRQGRHQDRPCIHDFQDGSCHPHVNRSSNVTGVCIGSRGGQGCMSGCKCGCGSPPPSWVWVGVQKVPRPMVGVAWDAGMSWVCIGVWA